MSDSMVNAIFNEYRDVYPASEYTDGSSITRRKYVLAELFDEELGLNLRRNSYTLDRIRESVSRKMIDKLAAEGYPSGSYKLEFMLDQEPSMRRVRVTVTASVDERMREKVVYFDLEEAKKVLLNPDALATIQPLTMEQQAAKELQERAMFVPLKMKRNIRMEK